MENENNKKEVMWMVKIISTHDTRTSAELKRRWYQSKYLVKPYSVRIRKKGRKWQVIKSERRWNKYG